MRKKYQCPVCGYYTLRTTYDICPVCFWEYDSLQTDMPNLDGGCNVPTLIMARINYRTYGASEVWFIERCRPPREEEREGRPYPFTEYYYDDKSGALYCGYKKKLNIKADRYGTPFDKTDYVSKIKYANISARISADDKASSGWKEILERSERVFAEDWRNDPDYADIDDEFKLNEMVLDNCTQNIRRLDSTVRRLKFAEYVKKLATADFKDVVLSLDDRLLKQLEDVCGCSVFVILEMGDEECKGILDELSLLARHDGSYMELYRAFKNTFCVIRWDVPEWMADWG